VITPRWSCLLLSAALMLPLTADSMDKKAKSKAAAPNGRIAASAAALRSAAALGGLTPASRAVPGASPRLPGFTQGQVLQQRTGVQALESIVRDPSTGVPRVIVPLAGQETASAAMADPVEHAKSFLAQQSTLLRMDDPVSECAESGVRRDELGMTHVRLQQTFQGIEVWGADAYVHIGQDGRVTMFNGAFRPTPKLSTTTPVVDSRQAIQIVRSDLSRAGAVEGVPEGLKPFLGYAGPTARMVVWHEETGVPHLAWAVGARSGLANDWQYFVDAISGTVLDKFNQVCFDGPVKATAADLNGVSRSIDTYLSGGTYYMLDAAEPMYNGGASSIPQGPVGGIMGLDLKNTDLSAQSTIYFSTSTDNQWSDPAVVSAHYNAAQTYNYFRTVFGRNSIDDKGMTIYSVVHATDGGKSMENAFWSSTLMCYGDGGSLFKPLAGGFDVAAHEMTHGVTQHSANLVYKDQSGALNESMSDVFAAALDSANWTIGEQVIKDLTTFPSGSLRSMSDPHNSGTPGSAAWQPATMAEFVSTTQDNGGVHINSGIPNGAFYLSAASIGRGKASHIWYRALTNYLTSSARFVDARIATESAAKDLFGNGSAELSAVSNAWDAVGVTSGAATKPPTVPQLQGTEWVLAVNTAAGDPNSLYIIRPVLQGNSGDFAPLSSTAIGNKPAVSDTGGIVVFVDADHRLRALNAASPSSPGEGYVDTGAVWSSVAVGPGLSSLALTSIYADTTIYYFNLIAHTSASFKIRTRSFDGTPIGTAVYCDEMSFDPSGRYLLFDTYNENKTTGGTIGFWNINLLDLATGDIQSVFPPQPKGIDLGNPSFSKASATRFVFDLIDANTQSDMVMGADFFTGDFGPIVGPLAGVGYPTYSGDGSKIAYHNTVTVNQEIHEVIEQVGVNATGTGPNGSASEYVLDATAPVWFVIGHRVTSVDQSSEGQLPASADLMQNYPNPFNPSTTISYQISDVRYLKLSVYDLLGREVAVLVDGQVPAGTHTVTWNAAGMASGVYFYRLTAGGTSVTKKMHLLK
jgi:bacillolysin